MSTNRDNKLALRRQSIRTLTDSELRTAHGGTALTASGTCPGMSPRSGATDGTTTQPVRQSGTAVAMTNYVSVQNPSGGSVLNPSGGRPAVR